jgi:hypothetical protein
MFKKKTTRHVMAKQFNKHIGSIWFEETKNGMHEK